MYPILFQFGPITIYSFGVFMALAALAAAWVVGAALKRRGYNPELASTMVFAAAIGGLVGARLLFIVEAWDNFLRAPMNYILTGAGFTWYGGFFGGAAAVSWVINKHKIPWLVGADIAAPARDAYGVASVPFAGDGDWGRSRHAVGRGVRNISRLGRPQHRRSLPPGGSRSPDTDL
jgi:phosphatidylglycerol:prolipoprotein diacylglycerol transferase